MSTSYSFIISVLQQAERYHQTTHEPSIEGFGNFLRGVHPLEKNELMLSEPENGGVQETVDSAISKYIIYLYRYARMYLKTALANTDFNHYDDFIFCLILFPEISMTKMELIELNIQEKTTGIEIINRLLKQKLIQQKINIKDKRSKAVSLTAKGKKAVLTTLPSMHVVAGAVSGNLLEDEKKYLVLLLQKLHLYHLPNYVSGNFNVVS
jgi:MarR family transcriptional regulator, lower aerobic nicotinate degradation pathway regulator